MTDREYLISPWIRVWHWTNALLILILILDTGFALPLLIGVGLGAVVHKASTAAPAETSAPAEASAPRTATTEGSNG